MFLIPKKEMFKIYKVNFYEKAIYYNINLLILVI